jgi:hypothetical protein
MSVSVVHLGRFVCNADSTVHNCFRFTERPAPGVPAEVHVSTYCLSIDAGWTGTPEEFSSQFTKATK